MVDVCASLGITIACEPSSDPPSDPKWKADAWRCTLTLAGRTFSTPYWCGIGHREWKAEAGEIVEHLKAKDGWRKPSDPHEIPKKFWTHPERGPSLLTIDVAERMRFRPIPPSAADVLASLCSDAMSVACGQSFEEFCGEFGYDTDSRKAETTYRTCQETALRLRGFLSDHYQRVMSAEH